jgi:hypothetical protein
MLSNSATDNTSRKASQNSDVGTIILPYKVSSLSSVLNLYWDPPTCSHFVNSVQRAHNRPPPRRSYPVYHPLSSRPRKWASIPRLSKSKERGDSLHKGHAYFNLIQYQGRTGQRETDCEHALWNVPSYMIRYLNKNRQPITKWVLLSHLTPECMIRVWCFGAQKG